MTASSITSKDAPEVDPAGNAPEYVPQIDGLQVLLLKDSFIISLTNHRLNMATILKSFTVMKA
jgi:hypothetical protein